MMPKKIIEKNKENVSGEINNSRKTGNETKVCRYCTNSKRINKFYKSYDFLDTDGKLSICTQCVNHLFNEFYKTHSRIDIAIYEVCHCVNIKYSSDVYSSLMRMLEKNNMQNVVSAINFEDDDSTPVEEIETIATNSNMSVFGKYFAILRTKYDNKNIDLSFDLYSSDRPEGYEDRSTEKPITEVIENVYSNKFSSLEIKWGTGCSEEEYSFLEGEYNDWAKTKDTEEKSVAILIKELCLQELKIRRKRNEGQDISKQDLETLTMIMDKAAVSPGILKENTSNKSANAYGVWLKDIETFTPAEWIENQKLFKDIEGIDQYVNRHFGRALKNYVGMQRDFRVIADKMEEGSSSEEIDLDTEEEENGE